RSTALRPSASEWLAFAFIRGAAATVGAQRLARARRRAQHAVVARPGADAGPQPIGRAVAASRQWQALRGERWPDQFVAACAARAFSARHHAIRRSKSPSNARRISTLLIAMHRLAL